MFSSKMLLTFSWYMTWLLPLLFLYIFEGLWQRIFQDFQVFSWSSLTFRTGCSNLPSTSTQVFSLLTDKTSAGWAELCRELVWVTMSQQNICANISQTQTLKHLQETFNWFWVKQNLMPVPHISPTLANETIGKEIGDFFMTQRNHQTYCDGSEARW